MAGSVHGWGYVWAEGACMAGGHVWQGVCMAGGMYGRGAFVTGGHAWQGGVHSRGGA